MKKLLIAAFIIVAAGTSAFAKDGTNKVDVKVKNNFAAKFYGAEDVSWTNTDNYVKASFTYADEKVEAFYHADGELIGVSRKVELKRLPLAAIQKIKKDYAGFKVNDSVEFEKDGNITYYVLLEDASKKQVLEVSASGMVSTFKPERN